MNDIEKAIEDLRGLSECSSISSTIFKEQHGKNFNLAISALEKQLNGGWIPVSKKMPEVTGKYLIFQSSNNASGLTHIRCASLTLDGKWRTSEAGAFYDYVVAWQPLPPAYKEVENE